MARYVNACGGDTRKAMTLYRLNLRLSQELFTLISCFEVCLRNRVCNHYMPLMGGDWLKDAATPGGIFDDPSTGRTQRIINDAVRRLGPHYTHFKLMAEMDFGFWRYLFAGPQFRAGGQTLLAVFPAKPPSTPAIQYNQTFVFNQLADINELRNRIAHHEPICFAPGSHVKDTTFARQHYGLILQLFQWMQIDEAALLYGIDHINDICNQIDAL
jgi:hypothetical protein